MYKLVNYPLDSNEFDFLTVACGAVMIQKGKLLLVREFPDDLFSFPGGSLENEESIEHTVKREVKEELSLDITLKGDPYIYSFVRFNDNYQKELVILFQFALDSVQGKINLGTDAKEMIWKGPNDDFSDTFPNVRYAFKYFLEKYGREPGYEIS